MPTVDAVSISRRATAKDEPRSGWGTGRVPAFARLAIAPRPVVTLGALGAFDDNGVTSSCLTIAGGRRFLFYTGWARGHGAVLFLCCVAVSDDEAAATGECRHHPSSNATASIRF